MMYATPTNQINSSEKTMTLSSGIFVKLCKDLKVFPVSSINNKIKRFFFQI